jgi:hypothetical protein
MTVSLDAFPVVYGQDYDGLFEIYLFAGGLYADAESRVAKPARSKFEGRAVLDRINIHVDSGLGRAYVAGEPVPTEAIDTLAPHAGFEQAVRVALCVSAGGLTGIRAAMANRFDLIIGLSVVTDVSESAARFDSRVKRFAKLIETSLPADQRDLTEIYDRFGFAGHAYLFHAADNPEDSWQAARFAGRPGFNVIAVPSADHGFFGPIGFHAILARMLSLPSESPTDRRGTMDASTG